MKRTMIAIAAMAAVFAGSASAQALVADSETLTYSLNGSVDSECTMTPNGAQSRNIEMTQDSAQGIAKIIFSCNSPYKVTVQSANGGMDHEQSTLVIPYQLRTGGSVGAGAVTYTQFDSDDLAVAGGAIIEESADWLSIASNEGDRQLNLDVGFTPDTFAVAGNYSDTLTVILTAVF